MSPPSTGPAAVPPPDGGWGWAVVLGSFISIGFSYAFPKAITVFFKDIQIIFHASYSQIAWISSIMLAVMYAAGESMVGFTLYLILECNVFISLNCILSSMPVSRLGNAKTYFSEKLYQVAMNMLKPGYTVSSTG